jgi:hypothetical protein
MLGLLLVLHTYVKGRGNCSTTTTKYITTSLTHGLVLQPYIMVVPQTEEPDIARSEEKPTLPEAIEMKSDENSNNTNITEEDEAHVTPKTWLVVFVCLSRIIWIVLN